MNTTEDPRILGILDRLTLQLATAVPSVLILPNLLSPEKFGIYTLAVSVFMLLRIFESFLQTATVKFCATEDVSRQKIFQTHFLAMRLVFIALFLVFLFPVKGLILRTYPFWELEPILLLFGILIPLELLRSHFACLLTAKEDIRKLFIQDLIFLTVFWVVFFLFIDRILTPLPVFLFQGTGTLGASLYLLWHHRRQIHLRFRLHREVIGKILRFSSLTFAVGLSILFLESMDIFMISFLNSPGEAGAYKLGRIPAVLTAIVVRGFLVTLMPRISRLHEQKSIQKILDLYRSQVKSLLKIFIPFAVLSPLLAILFFDCLYSGRYPEGKAVFLVFSLMGLLRSWHNPQGALLTGMGLVKYDAAAMLACLATNFFLNLAWIPKMGPLGAALATLTSVALASFIKETFIRRTLRSFGGNAP